MGDFGPLGDAGTTAADPPQTSTNEDDAATRERRVGRLLRGFDEALVKLQEAKPFAKPRYQTEIQQIAGTLLENREGLLALAERANLFDEAGVFHGGPWENPGKLLPQLVRGCLDGTGVYPIVEALSELRMLARAKRRVKGLGEEEAEAAASFLERTLVLNLDLVFQHETEESRQTSQGSREKASRLLAYLLEELPDRDLVPKVVEEIEVVAEQRRIQTETLEDLIRLAGRMAEPGSAGAEALVPFRRALTGPGPISEAHPELTDYRKALTERDEDALEEEAVAFGESLQRTGLSCPLHAVLIRHLRRKAPALLPASLGLHAVGQAGLEHHQELALQLITVGILPGTYSYVYGFSRMLDRGLLSRPEVTRGLRRLAELDLRPEVRRALLSRRRRHDAASANAILLAAAFAVLGQPLGIGQGPHPTCQAARGLSMWSQRYPAYLLEVLCSAARDGVVEVDFEGSTLRSSELPDRIPLVLDPRLDPVSMILVPHIDRIYDAMMRAAALRGQDPHRWVNPELYGRYVPSGFASAFDHLSGHVVNFADFVRRFYATHHPAFNDGHELPRPNPVGLCVTTTHGDLLGLHAVTLQRVEKGPAGDLRIYFYNPNDEGRQDWGQDIVATVAGNGEEEGESSLPFDQFSSRLYAFHYDPYEEGDAYAVPAEVVDHVTRLARESWGRAYTWA